MKRPCANVRRWNPPLNSEGWAGPSCRASSRSTVGSASTCSTTSTAPNSSRGTATGARPAWDPDGHGEHSVEAKLHALEHYVDRRDRARRVRRRTAGRHRCRRASTFGPGSRSSAFLHVSAPSRAAGVGSRLSEQLEQIARAAGDSEMVVSATPSENTVRFYLGRGFEPMAEPLAELFELEPEDVHMHKVL